MDVSRLADLPAAAGKLGGDRVKAATSLRHFCRSVDKSFQSPRHIRAIIECLEAVNNGWIDRLMVFMPPRHGKSYTITATYPAWYLGQHPDRDVMVVCYQRKLATQFSYRVRSLMRNREVFGKIFPGVEPQRGRQPLEEWQTVQGGKLLAAGIESGVTGRGAHLIVLDDIISGRLDASSPTIRDNIWATFQSDVYTRLHPGGAIIYTTTRWHEDDPAGRMLRQMGAGDGDRWHVLEMPAWDEGMQEALWPERYPEEALMRIKAQVEPRVWLSLYQQRPVEDEGDIIKREWWRAWPQGKPLPRLVYLIQVWDTAFEAHEDADDSACTIWGVWLNEETKRHEMILLDEWHGRVVFAELRGKALDLYRAWDESACGPVDVVLVEPKATGKPIASEMRRAGVPVHEFQMVRGDKGRELGKVPKAHLASVVWHNGGVWYVPWAKCSQIVIDQCAGIGGGAHRDDLADTAIMAAVYLRRTWWLQADGDLAVSYPDAASVKMRGAPRNDMSPPARRNGGVQAWGLNGKIVDLRRDAEYEEMGIA